MPIKYIVAGLGNPESRYASTRHNAGFMVIDRLSGLLGVKVDRAKFHALTCDTQISGERVLVMKPITYMNLSGVAVREASQYYKIPPERIIVICDDVSFDTGKMRIKRSGSHGGHNGLKSITEQLSSEDFVRIKMGVGKKPSPDYDLADWVLKDIPVGERQAFSDAADNAFKAIEMIISGNIEKAMNDYNC